ncbi:MAG: hypothetical protein ACXVY8_06810 [Gaiellaceae bacterium]
MQSADHESLDREIGSILDTARADIAAGREPDANALAARIRKAGGEAEAVGRALKQLEQVLTIQRARARLAAPPTPPSAAPAGSASTRPRRRAAFRAQPTISGNMEVRRARRDDTVVLSWDVVAAVTGWEVRFSERADARSEYVVRETLALPGTATSVELTLGELPLRVHLLGRANDRRLVRRAIVSALTQDNWDDRWQRRASAS